MKERRPRINGLSTRLRRQFHYERQNRWSESPDEKRRWNEALEGEGVRGVRRKLGRLRAGPPGLIRIGETWMPQGFAEAWLDWRDWHKINWSKWGVVLALFVAIVGLVRWLVA